VVVLTDGALWCEAAAAADFPGRLHILDFYHAAIRQPSPPPWETHSRLFPEANS
jgi:hypothetical protein